MSKGRRKTEPSKWDLIYDNETVDRIVASIDEDIAAGRGRVIYRRPGRPSLTGDAANSPAISFRVTTALRARIDAVAAEQDITVSELARKAIEAYVAGAR